MINKSLHDLPQDHLLFSALLDVELGLEVHPRVLSRTLEVFDFAAHPGQNFLLLALGPSCERAREFRVALLHLHNRRRVLQGDGAGGALHARDPRAGGVERRVNGEAVDDRSIGAPLEDRMTLPSLERVPRALVIRQDEVQVAGKLLAGG